MRDILDQVSSAISRVDFVSPCQCRKAIDNKPIPAARGPICSSPDFSHHRPHTPTAYMICGECSHDHICHQDYTDI